MTSFTPEKLLAPTIGVSHDEYMTYLRNYGLYCETLAAYRANFKSRVKNDQALVRAAASRGCVVKKTFSEGTKVLDSRHFGEGVSIATAVVTTQEVPIKLETPDEKSLAAKRLRKAAKKRRYKRNKRLRSAKLLAATTFNQARAATNIAVIAKKQSKTVTADRKSKTGKFVKPIITIGDGKKPMEGGGGSSLGGVMKKGDRTS
jgi:hypothetical protein